MNRTERTSALHELAHTDAHILLCRVLNFLTESNQVLALVGETDEAQLKYFQEHWCTFVEGSYHFDLSKYQAEIEQQRLSQLAQIQRARMNNKPYATSEMSGENQDSEASFGQFLAGLFRLKH